jgi:hypothetical protein
VTKATDAATDAMPRSMVVERLQRIVAQSH